MEADSGSGDIGSCNPGGEHRRVPAGVQENPVRIP